MYTIYHIPGIKVGCSENVEKRIKQQGYTEYEVIEIIETRKEASDREIYWQEKLGYGRDSWNTYLGTRIAGLYAIKPEALAKKSQTIKNSEAWKNAIPKRAATWSNKVRNSETLQAMFREKQKNMMTPEAQIKRIESKKKIVLQYHKDGTFIAEWSSAVDAAEILKFIKAGEIGSCARGEQKTAKKFIWKYKDKKNSYEQRVTFKHEEDNSKNGG
jgi:hypothetical protein